MQADETLMLFSYHELYNLCEARKPPVGILNSIPNCNVSLTGELIHTAEISVSAPNHPSAHCSTLRRRFKLYPSEQVKRLCSTGHKCFEALEWKLYSGEGTSWVLLLKKTLKGDGWTLFNFKGRLTPSFLTQLKHKAETQPQLKDAENTSKTLG